MGLVVLDTCEAYEKERLDACLDRVLTHFGGMEAFVRPGMRVLLKPNLLNAKKPADAATTHPAFVEAVARAVMKAGGVVTIADSPGGPYAIPWLKRVYASTGMEDLANRTGAKLNFDLRVEEVDLPRGILLKKIRLLKPIVDADVVINLAKLKTHLMMVYTGAVKNMFGAIAGTEKADYHARMHDYDRFATALVDIHLATRPTLNLIDGITAMEGAGPGSGTPRHLGVVIASLNAFDADAVAQQLVGIPWEKVPVMRAGHAAGRFMPEELQVLGKSVSSLSCQDFDVPSLHMREKGAVPKKTLLSMLAAVTRPRPVIDQRRCIRCKRCQAACPVKTIHTKPDGALKVDSASCIRCFCCHELCPEDAIDIRRGLLSRILVGPGLAGRGKADKRGSE
jgi:uncharacterized protein (DUF362 family)/Pyruvate/2-oxoacid:ferredoxin oxidoreductase delta subunit